MGRLIFISASYTIFGVWPLAERDAPERRAKCQTKCGTRNVSLSGFVKA
jgi:hypothetical protein